MDSYCSKFMDVGLRGGGGVGMGGRRDKDNQLGYISPHLSVAEFQRKDFHKLAGSILTL